VGQQLSLAEDLLFSFSPRCPACRKGRLFRPWTVTALDSCAVCHEKLGQNDVGDGASVFLIFLFGATIVPLAWLFENIAHPPLWVHAALWSGVMLGLIAFILPAVKAYIILLDYRHRHEKAGP
jgi:uncharacterized protein (DUF983 family)